MSRHVSVRGDRFVALEPVKQGLARIGRGTSRDVARSRSLRLDHGTQYTSEHFRNEASYRGVGLSFGYVAEPETNGVAERVDHALKELVIYDGIVPPPWRASSLATRRRPTPAAGAPMSRPAKIARRHHRSEPEARAVLDDFTALGLTPTVYYTQRSLSRGRLRYWQRRRSLTPPPRNPAFVALALPSPLRAEAHVEILRGAVVLRVREDIDVSRFARLLDAVAERSPR